MATVAVDRRDDHRRQLESLQTRLAGAAQSRRLQKKTVSNLFRYDGRHASGRPLDLSWFNRPLHLDQTEQTVDVQGLATYESLVDFVLPRGFLPLITPELKHITVGGATAGIGIESNSWRFGFVHNGLLEAEVLLADGRVVTCSPQNEFADLFHGLPNSYGTLGYILRAKLRLRPATAYVNLRTERFQSPRTLLEHVRSAVQDPEIDYIEGLAYSDRELYVTTGRQTASAGRLTSIYGSTIFYREISRPGEILLRTRDYLFRYDPDWFWNLPEEPLHQLFRRLAPPRLRNSAVYTHYAALAPRLPFRARGGGDLEKLIQDWEVPWQHAEELLEFAFGNLDLAGRPLLVTPIRVPASAPLYPIEPNQLYLNLGSYGFVRRPVGQPQYQTTKTMDRFCFDHGGIKMLYSSTFLDEREFNRIYGGSAYAALKAKYDPQGLLPTLYEKAVSSR